MKSKKKQIYLSSPTMNGLEMNYINQAFETNWIAPLGENVNQFERELAEMVNIKYGVALSSGTAAIHLALKAVGVKRNDYVFCSDLTFAATCNPICYEGAIPVFIDSEINSWNMSPKALEQAFLIYPKPVAVIVVHLYGTPANLEEIEKICNKYQVPLIEDAAESLGAYYKNKQTGTCGKIGIYSFNGNKIITTSGGGMAVTNDYEIAEKLRFWATQAREKERFYEHKEIGYNYRMSNIVAGIGRGQLHTLKSFIEKKKEIYQKYKEAFADINYITMNPVPLNCKSNYWLSCIQISKNSKITPFIINEELEKELIESRPIWKPMHMQPIFQTYAYVKEEIEAESISEELFKHGVCLPSDIKNTEDDMNKIITIIRNLFD